ncbi:MAG: VWA domain-containing protein [Firmicutes bacterium]|nr:VWA domain-containing protein [Bacillota bacterium]
MADQLTIARWIEANRRDVVNFSRYLRGQGFSVAVAETIQATAILAEQAEPDSLATMVLWRVIYAKTPDQWQQFESLFHRYFELGSRFQKLEASIFDPDSTESRAQSEPQRTFSVGVSARRPLLGYNPHWGAHYPLHPDPGINYGRMRLTTRVMLKRWAFSKGFHKQSGFGSDRNWRKIMFNSLRRGGELVEWITWGPKPSPPRLVILLDVSGSMRQYAPFYLGLAWQLLRSDARVEVFAASTHITRITPRLRHSGPLGPNVIDTVEIGGGTRLGWAFFQMWQQYRQYLTRRTIFLVASDGFDTGESWRISQYFPLISHAVRVVYWFNPLLLEPNYTPRSSALIACLPWCQFHVGVRDEQSWQKLSRDVFSPALFKKP